MENIAAFTYKVPYEFFNGDCLNYLLLLSNWKGFQLDDHAT